MREVPRPDGVDLFKCPALEARLALIRWHATMGHDVYASMNRNQSKIVLVLTLDGGLTSLNFSASFLLIRLQHYSA